MKTMNVMKSGSFFKHSYIAILILIIQLCLGCSSDDNSPAIIIGEPDIQEPFDGTALKDAIAENRNKAIQEFSLTVETGGSITGEQGTVLYFPPDIITDQHGDPVTGEVTIRLIEIYDRSSMVLTKMPTNGKRENGDIETLISAGEFYIDAYQGEESLLLSGAFQINVPTEEFDPEMRIFDGQDNDCDGIQCDIVWEENTEKGLEPGQGDGAEDGTWVNRYIGFLDNFGWTNLDRWIIDPRPKTSVSVAVPEGYDNTNCNVYITIDNEPTALALLDIYNEETSLFTEHYGHIPIGMEVHFIFVSKQEDAYVYAVQPATIGENHIETIGTLTTGTEEDLTAVINELP
ncbi:hypothetical protein [Aquimarina hainanensis]